MPATSEAGHSGKQPRASRAQIRSPASAAAGIADALPPTLASSSVVGVVVVDDDGTIAYVNDTFVELLGAGCVDDLIDLDFREEVLADPAQWQSWREAETTAHARFEVKTRRGDKLPLTGDVAPFRGPDGTPRTIAVVSRDGAGEQLIQHAARMEAIAGLTTGIAHDFNNLLTVLIGNLYLIGEELRDRDAAFKKIKSARDAAVRGADLTKQLLQFARNNEPSVKAIKLAAAVTRISPLVEKVLGSRIRLTVRTNGVTAAVEANSGQLESALINLVINARDAIDGHGNVLIDLKEALVDARTPEAPSLAPGRYVKLSVIDDGPGIPAAIIDRVFEPFYTTKSAERGTGLGLSMVQWVAERAGGCVTIRSAPGRGTVVAMLLPVHGVDAEETSSRTMPLMALPSGQEVVVLAMADGEIRAMTEQSLAVLGYDVRACAVDREIVAAVDEHKGELVVLDGSIVHDAALATTLLGRDPPVKLLVLGDQALDGESRVVVLQKPFSLADLARSVRDALDGAPQ